MYNVQFSGWGLLAIPSTILKPKGGYRVCCEGSRTVERFARGDQVSRVSDYYYYEEEEEEEDKPVNDGSRFSSFRLPSVTLSSLILKDTHNSTTPPIAPLPLFLPLSCLVYPKHNHGPCIKVSPKGVSLQKIEMKKLI